MSYCKKEGKDEIVFLSKKDEEEPMKELALSIEKDAEEMPILLPDGSINYSCGCVSGLQGFFTGPCGFEFREWHECTLRNRPSKESDSTAEDEDEVRFSKCEDKMLKFFECAKQTTLVDEPIENVESSQSESKNSTQTHTSENTAASTQKPNN